jgi:sugar-specific transcriptional regulator TrmB
MSSYQKILQSIGLSETESVVYEYILKKGLSPATPIIDGTGLKRGNIYNILESLVEKRVLSMLEKNKIAHWYIDSPQDLYAYVESGYTEIEHKKQIVSALLPSLTSAYALTTNKPVVSYYEGEAGMLKVLEDTLTSKTEVLQYIDVQLAETEYADVNAAYLKKRAKSNIIKKLLIPDSKFARELYAGLEEEAVSDVRFIHNGDCPFEVSMQIYDDKISYITLVKGKTIAVIIEDQYIYNMHRTLFMNLFGKAETV